MCREPTALFGEQSSSTCSWARPKAFRQCVAFSEGLIVRSNPELYRAPGLNSGYCNQFHVQVTEAQVSQDCPWHMVGCGPRSSDLGFVCSCRQSPNPKTLGRTPPCVRDNPDWPELQSLGRETGCNSLNWGRELDRVLDCCGQWVPQRMQRIVGRLLAALNCTLNCFAPQTVP